MTDIPVSAISDVTDTESVRVVIFINNSFVHVPLPALLKGLQNQIDAQQALIDDLEARVTALEP